MAGKIKEDLDFEMAFFEGILQKRRDFVQALMALGDLYTQKGFYQKGLEVDLRLVTLRPEDPYVFYNLACSYSLLKDLDRSLAAIKKALILGYDDFEFMAQDNDLGHLRRDKRFQELITSVAKS